MKLDSDIDGKGGGGWTGANIKRDTGALFNNKAVRIFAVLVLIGMAVKYFLPGVVS